MGFYGNIVTEPPQSYRYIDAFNKDKKAGTLTAREVGATLRVVNEDGNLDLKTQGDAALIVNLAKRFGNTEEEGFPQIAGEILYDIYIDTKGDVEGGQGSLLKVDNDGLISEYGKIDLQLPLANNNKAGLLSPTDKNRINSLFEASQARDPYSVVFHYKNEEGETESKSYIVLDGDLLPEVPYTNVERWYINENASYLRKNLQELPIKMNYIFYNNIEEGTVPYTAYFSHKENGLVATLSLNTGTIYTSQDIPTLEGDYGWTYQGVRKSLEEVLELINKEVKQNLFFVATDELVVALLTGIQVKSEEDSSHSYLCDIENGATAILPAATREKLGLVMINNSKTSDELGSSQEYQVPSTSHLIERIDYATRLAIAPGNQEDETSGNGQDGWLTAADKAMLDNISFESGTTYLSLVAVNPQNNNTERISTTLIPATYTKIGKTYYVACSGSFEWKAPDETYNQWQLAIGDLPGGEEDTLSGFTGYLSIVPDKLDYVQLFSSFTRLDGIPKTDFALIKQGYVDEYNQIKYRVIHCLGEGDMIGIPQQFVGTIHFTFNAFYNA